eukprot:s1260_g5.t1
MGHVDSDCNAELGRPFSPACIDETGRGDSAGTSSKCYRRCLASLRRPCSVCFSKRCEYHNSPGSVDAAPLRWQPFAVWRRQPPMVPGTSRWRAVLDGALLYSKLSRTLGLDCRALEPHVGQLQMFETPRCVTPKRPGSGRGAPCLLHEGRAEHLALHHQACISGPKAASPISWLAYAPFTWKSGNRKMP